ncbi:MAG: baseplate J/gp47 family protein [Kofleriaceae bacterium]|nr:baseplate J/gp47 family protein [Kofleriaceae bacterium]
MIPRPAHYTDLDFDRLRARLLELARTEVPGWDPDVATLGTTLLELMAYVGDVVLFRQDQLARETRIVTATQRRALSALAALVGERLFGSAAATVELELSLARSPTADVIVPAGTIVRSEESPRPTRFQLLAPVMLGAGQDPPLVVGQAEHSETHSVSIETAGTPSLIVGLVHAPFLEGSLVASTPQGVFAPVDSFLATGATDRHVVVDVGDDGRARLRFGDGSRGVPPAGRLSLTYKSGGGTSGNVAAGTLRVVESTVLDATGRPVSLRVVNRQPAAGGIDRETIVHARRRIPEAVRAPGRTVAREDFEIHARQVAGVARALMLTRNEDPTIEENAGILYVIPHGGGAPSQTLRDEVLRQVTVVHPSTLTFQVRVQAPVYAVVDVTAQVYLAAGATASAVAASLRERLASFFAISLPDGSLNPQIDFGFYLRDHDANPVGELAWSQVANVVIDTPGIRKLAEPPHGVLLQGRGRDVQLAGREFPVLGTVTIVRVDTGEAL